METHFIDFTDIHLEANERPEDSFQRLMTFLEDILLKASSISHHGDPVTEDEVFTPLEHFVVLTWSKDIHPELPKLVMHGYGTELRLWTLVSIKPKVSPALNSLLGEARGSDDVRVMLTASYNSHRTTPAKTPPKRGYESLLSTKIMSSLCRGCSFQLQPFSK